MDDMVGVLDEGWSPLFQLDTVEHISFESVEQHYGHLLPDCKECKLDPLSVKGMSGEIKKMKKRRAVASCGWRAPEMQDLPKCIIEVAVLILRAHEEEKLPWPRMILEAIQTHIGKGSLEEMASCTDSALLFAPRGLETRPICNISPWYVAWDSARFKDMEPWREEWMTEAMHGGRSEHEIYEVSWEVALEKEMASLYEKIFSICSIDKKKVLRPDTIPSLSWSSATSQRPGAGACRPATIP